MADTSGPSGPVSAPTPAAAPDTESDLSSFLDSYDNALAEPPSPPHKGLAALTLGAVGVVYGDIGTSPIYAFREAIKPVAGDAILPADVLGLLSLLIWSLILIVTVKYVLILLRADNRGEGGVLALYMLARQAMGRRSLLVLGLGIAGAALFYRRRGDHAGDFGPVGGRGAGADPAAAADLGSARHAGHPDRPVRGPASWHVADAPVGSVRSRRCGFWCWRGSGSGILPTIPAVLAAFNPVAWRAFLSGHLGITSVVLGAVFLSVTGAEALYADLGHFGRRPIALAWIVLVFPALVLNYLGQGALVLADPTAALTRSFAASRPLPCLPSCCWPRRPR